MTTLERAQKIADQFSLDLSKLSESIEAQALKGAQEDPSLVSAVEMFKTANTLAYYASSEYKVSTFISATSDHWHNFVTDDLDQIGSAVITFIQSMAPNSGYTETIRNLMLARNAQKELIISLEIRKVWLTQLKDLATLSLRYVKERRCPVNGKYTQTYLSNLNLKNLDLVLKGQVVPKPEATPAVAPKSEETTPNSSS